VIPASPERYRRVGIDVGGQLTHLAESFARHDDPHLPGALGEGDLPRRVRQPVTVGRHQRHVCVLDEEKRAVKRITGVFRRDRESDTLDHVPE
jgi:hypothetical protein